MLTKQMPWKPTSLSSQMDQTTKIAFDFKCWYQQLDVRHSRQIKICEAYRTIAAESIHLVSEDLKAVVNDSENLYLYLSQFLIDKMTEEVAIAKAAKENTTLKEDNNDPN